MKEFQPQITQIYADKKRIPSAFICVICGFLFLLSAFPQTATNATIYPSPAGPYLHVEWQGIIPGHIYQLQFSADVVHWFPDTLITNTCATNAAWVQTTPLAAHPKCFFRLQEISQPSTPQLSTPPPSPTNLNSQLPNSQPP